MTARAKPMFSSSGDHLDLGERGAHVLDGAVAGGVVDEHHLEVDVEQVREQRGQATVELGPRAVADEQHGDLRHSSFGHGLVRSLSAVVAQRSRGLGASQRVAIPHAARGERFFHRAFALDQLMTLTYTATCGRSRGERVIRNSSWT